MPRLWIRTCKAVQRSVLSAAARSDHVISCFTYFVVALCVLSTVLAFYVATSSVNSLAVFGENPPCWRDTNNIGGRSFSDVLCSGPIDAVITWVNGSDAEWIRLKDRTKRIENGLPPLPLCPDGFISNTSLSVCESDDNIDSEGANRYRDNNELKYNFRSLEKYAPWLRRIYLVTSGQVPAWLDVSHPRVRVVSHIDIFPNPAHLPVFSSPAIEVHLHRIPGLSNKWLYVNDDVMLGAEVWPDDFYTHAQGSKVYLSWEVPKCAPGCTESWLGDGACDTACNTTRCLYDGGKSSRYSTSSDDSRSSQASAAAPVVEDPPCVPGCPLTWPGDRMCDQKCNTAACAFDGSDCGMENVWQQLPGAQLNTRDFTTDSWWDYQPVNSSPVSQLLRDVASLVVSRAGLELDGLVGSGNFSSGAEFCERVTRNATAVWLQASLLAILSARDLVASFSSSQLDATVLSAYVNLSVAFDAAQNHTARELAILAAVANNGALDAMTRLACDAAVNESSCLSWLRRDSNVNANARFNIACNGSALTQGNCSVPPDGLTQCTQAATRVMHRQWNSSDVAIRAHDFIAGRILQLSAESAEFLSEGTIKTALLSAHYNVLVLLFNGDPLNTLVPTIAAHNVWAMLPANSPQLADAYVQSSTIVGSEAANTTMNTTNSSAVAPSLGYSASEVTSRRQEWLERAAPLIPVSHATFAISLGISLQPQLSNGSAGGVGMQVTRRLIFNTTLMRRPRVDFTAVKPLIDAQSKSNATASNISVDSSSVGAIDSVIVLDRSTRAVINVSTAAHSQTAPKPAKRRLGDSIEVVDSTRGNIVGQGNVISDSPQILARPISGMEALTRDAALHVLHHARTRADDRLLLISRKTLLASPNDAEKRTVSEAWAAVSSAFKAHSGEASDDNDNIETAPLTGREHRGLRDLYESFEAEVASEVAVDGGSLKQDVPHLVQWMSGFWESVHQFFVAQGGNTPLPADIKEPVVNLTNPGKRPAEGRRLGADTYADSLVHTTRLIASKYGRKSSRRVPAHMPHMIDSTVMTKLQATFPAAVDATSSHRFRNSEDLQFATAYFFFIMDGGAREGLSLQQYFSRELDTNGDGVLSDNELRTLALLVFRHGPSLNELTELRNCLAPPQTDVHVSETTLSDGTQEVRSETVVRRPGLTAERVGLCPLAMDALARHARFSPTHQEIPLDEVGFEMIGDDVNKTLAQLDSLRMRKAKFLCINDDMHTAPAEVVRVLHDFYEALFPLPSQFELPAGRVNPVLYITPLRKALGLPPPVPRHLAHLPPWSPSRWPAVMKAAVACALLLAAAYGASWRANALSRNPY